MAAVSQTNQSELPPPYHYQYCYRLCAVQLPVTYGNLCASVHCGARNDVYILLLTTSRISRYSALNRLCPCRLTLSLSVRYTVHEVLTRRSAHIAVCRETAIYLAPCRCNGLGRSAVRVQFSPPPVLSAVVRRAPGCRARTRAAPYDHWFAIANPLFSASS